MNELVVCIQLCIFLIYGNFCVRMGRQYAAMCISLWVILANTFVVKQVVLFGLDVTASDMYFILGAFTLNRTQELYGKKAALNCLYASFMALFSFNVAVSMQSLIIPSQLDMVSDSLKIVFSSLQRVTLASLFSYWLSQRIDVYLYHLLRKREVSQYQASALSVSMSQFFDTICFSFLGLYGIVANIWHVIFFSYAIKVIFVLISYGLCSVSSAYKVKPGKLNES